MLVSDVPSHHLDSTFCIGRFGNDTVVQVLAVEWSGEVNRTGVVGSCDVW